MILIYTHLESVRRYCEENKSETTDQPYFTEAEHEDGWLLPEDSLIEQAIAELGVPFVYAIAFRDRLIIVEP